ncbi:F-box and leucine-rich repeat protein 13 isoform X2 [Xylocopa sonorina]|uniref:F-box and leucine-rich repeat protein 13 isoform X2 n=1 Tax=Xylocopa sonorina TaxID=1818115 RepID=UPI00403A8BDC
MAIMSDNKIRMNNLTETDNFQLPIDVIIHILSYLSTSDRMSAGLVNQTWHEASLAMEFVDQEELVLGRPRADNLNEVLEVLQHSTRPFYHFTFREVELKRNMPIWDLYGPHMKSLVLLCCDLSEKTLVEIFKYCKSLKVLHINACRECLMSGRLLEDENDIKELVQTFKHVQELSLGYNRFLSDALFNRLVAICPNLESLSLMGCQISFHCGLYKKFYPRSITLSDASKSVLTFLNTLQYLKQQAARLKHLNFGYTLIDGTALATLSAMEDLRLESLMLQGCYQLTIEGIRGLTQYQTCLKVLDISFCVRITDVSLLHICKNLTRLETLRIKRCRAVTDNGIKYIKLLKNLKELDISEDEQLTGDCITRGIDSDTINLVSPIKNHVTEETIRKENMRILSANALHLHEESVESISKSFPNLRQLELSFCFNGVTDKTIQMIFKELVHLQTLKISHCVEVSDAGLTGMGAGNHEYVEKIQVVHKPEFTESRLRISLRSKAEEEIVRDADRKREIMHLCENVSKPLSTFSGFSLIRLKCLQELDLSGCNKITDVSLKHAFAFLELRILNLSQCQQITHIGLNYLSKNNPAIENLNLNHCYNISDIGISYLAQRLHRLKRLLIQGCSQLTDHTLDFIKLYCKSLHYLDSRYCRGMTVAGLESMTHFNVDWHKHVDDMVSSGNEIPPPPAPPLPSLPSLP